MAGPVARSLCISFGTVMAHTSLPRGRTMCFQLSGRTSVKDRPGRRWSKQESSESRRRLEGSSLLFIVRRLARS